MSLAQNTWKEKSQSEEKEEAVAETMEDEYSEFNNEEYHMRNVRLRPMSGLTHADETRDGRQSNVSRGGEGASDQEANSKTAQDR